MTRLAVSELRGGLSEALGRVAYGNERLVVHKKGKDMAAVVPIADLEILEELEDLGLFVLAEEAKARSKGTLTLEELRERLGL